MILLPCTVYRIAHTHTHSGRCTIFFTLHWNSVALGYEVMTLRSRDYLLSAADDDAAHTLTWCSFPSLINVSVSKQTLVMSLKVYCSCMLQCILNLMEKCKSCSYVMNDSDLGWSHNSFHECSVTMLSNFICFVLFHGGATLVVLIDCKQALPELRNFTITRFKQH